MAASLPRAGPLAYRRMWHGAVAAGPAALAASEPAEAALRTHRRGPCCVLAAEPLEAFALRLGLLETGGLARLLARALPGPSGRARCALVALSAAQRLHLRPAQHGGLLAALWGGRLLGIRRPLRELRVAALLRARGAPVARPAFVAAERRFGLWRAAVATWHEPRACDAAAFLAAGPAPPRVVRAAAAAGRALRRFHDAGGRHPDLHAGNLLLRETEAAIEALLVDLDRARCGAPPPPGVRLAEIMRLHRSLVKRGLDARVGPPARAAFLAAYTGSDRALRRALLRRLPRELRRLAIHRLGYRGPSRGRERGAPLVGRARGRALRRVQLWIRRHRHW
jgi:hypothetical protein